MALILIKSGFDAENVIAAALLHDVVEDTGYTLQELVADADVRKRSWQERKQEHLDLIATASVEARAIVLSDKLHNLGTMLYDLEAGDEIWSRS